MRIPTLFRRDPADRRFVLPEIEPGAEWVVAGEGVATRKYDGVCVAYLPELDPTVRPAVAGALDGWWAQAKVRPGAEPPHFVEVEVEASGVRVGWEPAEGTRLAGPLAQAVAAMPGPPEPGTYELIGPKIGRDPEKVGRHVVIEHARADVVDAPRDYEGLRRWLHAHPYEGVVWRHPDGRMVKVKRRDLPRA